MADPIPYSGMAVCVPEFTFPAGFVYLLLPLWGVSPSEDVFSSLLWVQANIPWSTHHLFPH